MYFTFTLVDGSSDDLDEPIKEIFQDREFVEEHHLCSINSINWARILVQVKRIKMHLNLTAYAIFSLRVKDIYISKQLLNCRSITYVSDGTLCLHLFPEHTRL